MPPPRRSRRRCRTHFHLDRASFATQAGTILGTYEKVRAALLDSTNILRIRTDAEAAADRGVDPGDTPYPATPSSAAAST